MSQPQIECGVCQTRQDNAWDCAVCGSPLHEKPRHWAVPVETVEGLEPTRLDDGGNVMVEEVPGFEPTSADDGIAPLPDEVEGLELTSFAAAGPPAPEPLIGFEPTAIDPAPMPMAPPVISCRYCGTAWQPGASVMCSRCGMRVALRPRVEDGQDGERATCQGCGTPDQQVGQVCRRCEQQVRARSS